MEILIHQNDRVNKKLLKELDLENYDVEINEGDIGCGADWWFTALTVVGMAGMVFFSGKKIEENLEAWVKIGARIKNIFKNKKETPIFIDKEAAIALAVESITRKIKKVKSIQLVVANDLSEYGLDKIYNDGRKKDELITFPYNFYILTFKVNDFYKFIYCIKSNGEIRYKDVFSESPNDYFENWDTIDEIPDYDDE